VWKRSGLSLVRPLLGLVLATCQSLRSTAPLSAPLKTEATDIDVQSSGGHYFGKIAFTFVNTTGKELSAVVMGGCCAWPQLEKSVNGKWVLAYAPSFLAVRSSDLIIPPGETYRDTLQIFANAGDFRVSPLDGVYRFHWILATGRDAYATKVQKVEAISNNFRLVSRPASKAIHTYANPVDIDYKYNFEQRNEGISYRSGADPVIVVQGSEYYLFETIGEGYWHSTDLGTWQHITPSRWPITDVVAPAVLSVRDTIYLLPSTTSPLPIMMLTKPASGQVEFYNRLLPWLPMARDRESGVLAKPDSVQPGPWDPQFFQDSATERWFLYWNSSNAYPLHVIELDKSKELAYKGTPRWLFGLDPERHGWERFGQDHRDTTVKPYIEGAWMTKYGGRYYLQYGAPGTEYNVYATGVYVGDDPLGPFTYAPYNPVAYKPAGFVHGAGHGNTFQDIFGNWWNTSTPWIGNNWHFERRIALHPAGFDSDGQMYVDTRFGDFPHWLPTKDLRGDQLFTGWMLLSYHKTAVASSARDSFPAGNVTDENPRTFWVASQNRPGETLTLDLGQPYDVKAIQINYADYKSGIYESGPNVYTRFRLQASVDGSQWKTVADLSREGRDHPNAYLELPATTRARFIRYEHIHVGAATLAISDFRVFGNGDGVRPATPTGLSAIRNRDQRDATLSWRAVPGVVGYNLRWGISPSKLYQTYQRFADQGTSLELRALTVGQPYQVAIESFDENGVSTLSAPVPIR
jgi:xylan 1,4-beta-xylosidase